MSKMVLIGAGSAVFTQGLVSDLIRDSKRRDWHLALVDTDAGALETAAGISGKMIEARRAGIKLTCSTDRTEVLPGADYVVTTIGVGGRRAWEQDVFIPRKYGVFQPVGDSVMPGGISRAMRMIPAMLDIARDVVRLCPDARFFNYSNPMAFICRAVRKETGFPVTGLCHGVYNTEGKLARFAGLDRKRVTSLGAGVNHLTFIYDFRLDGKDAWPVIREKLNECRADGAGLPHPFSWELFDAYGAYPAPGDRHIVEYFAERFPGGAYAGKTLGVDAFSFEGTIEAGDNAYAEMGRLARSPEPLDEAYFEKFSGEHEQLLEIIHSMELDERKVFSVNLPNNGAVPGLPAFSVLEAPAAATARGLLPLQIGDFPRALCGVLLKHLAIAETVVEAAVKGSRELFVEAVMLGGYMTDGDAVSKMADELLAAHERYLPQFKRN